MATKKQGHRHPMESTALTLEELTKDLLTSKPPGLDAGDLQKSSAEIEQENALTMSQRLRDTIAKKSHSDLGTGVVLDSTDVQALERENAALERLLHKN